MARRFLLTSIVTLSLAVLSGCPGVPMADIETNLKANVCDGYPDLSTTQGQISCGNPNARYYCGTCNGKMATAPCVNGIATWENCAEETACGGPCACPDGKQGWNYCYYQTPSREFGIACQCPPPGTPSQPAPSCQDGAQRPCTNPARAACTEAVEICIAGTWSDCQLPCTIGTCRGVMEIDETCRSIDPNKTCKSLDPLCHPECDPKAREFTDPNFFVSCGDVSCNKAASQNYELCINGFKVCGELPGKKPACKTGCGQDGFYRLTPGVGLNVCAHAPGCEPINGKDSCPSECSTYLGKPGCPAPTWTAGCATTPSAWVCDPTTGRDFRCMPSCDPSAVGSNDPDCKGRGYTFWKKQQLENASTCFRADRCEPLPGTRAPQCTPECDPRKIDYKPTSCSLRSPWSIERCQGTQLCTNAGYWSNCGVPCTETTADGTTVCGHGLAWAGARCEAAGQCSQLVTTGVCCGAGEAKKGSFTGLTGWYTPSGLYDQCTSLQYCMMSPNGPAWSPAGVGCADNGCGARGVQPLSTTCEPKDPKSIACIGPETCNNCDDDRDGISDEDSDIFGAGAACALTSSDACSTQGRQTCDSAQRMLVCSQCSGAKLPFAQCGADASACFAECQSSYYSANVCGCAPTAATISSSPNAEWPAACWRPYASTSWLNRPLAALDKTRLAANWQNIRNQLVAQTPNWLEAPKDGNAGEPTYYSKPSDPEYMINCTTTGCPLQKLNKPVRIPAYAVPENGKAAPPNATNSDPDNHLTVIDATTNTEYAFYQFQTYPLPQASGATVNVSWAHSFSLSGDGRDPNNATGTAARTANLAGRLRIEELMAGQINHALIIVVPCVSGARVFPAGNQDALVCGAILQGSTTPTTDPSLKPNAPAIGQHFFYDRPLTGLNSIDSLTIPEWKKVILRALATYGAFVTDTTGNDCREGGQFCEQPGQSPRGWGFEQEGGLQYVSAGAANRWFKFGKDTYNGCTSGSFPTKCGWQCYNPNTSVTTCGNTLPGDAASDPADRWLGKFITNKGDPDWVKVDFGTYLKVLDECVAKGTCP